MENIENTTELKYLIGKRVHDFRIKNNYTQAQFAETIDISINFLSEIENGKKGMSQETLYKLCAFHQISADYILFGVDHNDCNEIPQNPREIIKIANTLNINELNTVIDYLNSLKKMLILYTHD